MKSVSLSLIVAAASFVAGCASPPFTTPDVIEDYRGGMKVKAKVKGDELTDVQRQCWLDGVSYPNDLRGQIQSARDRLFQRSCVYAYHYDGVKAFKARSDQATLGFATVAAIGAATDSHTDFVKSMVGLMGLTAATRIYINPNVQMSVYMKSAVATQCMADSLRELEGVVVGGGIPATRSAGYSTIDSVASGLNYLKYHPDIYPSMFNVNPILGAEIVRLTANPDQDAANKKAAIDFLYDVNRLSDKNLRLIRAFVEATMTDQAFNIENSIKLIPTTLTPKPETGGAVNAAATNASNKVALLQDRDADQKKLLNDMAMAFSSMQAAMETDGKLPYDDLIRINNEFSKCMTPIVGLAQ